VLAQIRAASPFPGAHTWFGETLVTVTRARREASFTRALEPGEAEFTERGAVVRTADGAILVEEGRDDADAFLSASDFLTLLREVGRAPC